MEKDALSKGRRCLVANYSYSVEYCMWPGREQQAGGSDG